MTGELPPLPDGPPIPGVIYPAREAVRWIRTMTPKALVKAARRDPERFPSRKPGRRVGFSAEDINVIVAATSRAQPRAERPVARRRSRPQITAVAELPQDAAPLVAKPQSARRRRKVS